MQEFIHTLMFTSSCKEQEVSQNDRWCFTQSKDQRHQQPTACSHIETDECLFVTGLFALVKASTAPNDTPAFFESSKLSSARHEYFRLSALLGREKGAERIAAMSHTNRKK